MGKESEKGWRYIYIYIHTHTHTHIPESLCCTSETNIVNQLYSNIK